MKRNDFYFSGTRKEMTFYHCSLILETETEPGTKSCFHYLCSKAFVKLNDGNPLDHFNEESHYIIIIFIKVVNDATPCFKGLFLTSLL